MKTQARIRSASITASLIHAFLPRDCSDFLIYNDLIMHFTSLPKVGSTGRWSGVKTIQTGGEIVRIVFLNEQRGF